MIDDAEFALFTVIVLVVELLAVSVLISLLTNNIQPIILAVIGIILSFMVLKIDKIAEHFSKN